VRQTVSLEPLASVGDAAMLTSMRAVALAVLSLVACSGRVASETPTEDSSTVVDTGPLDSSSVAPDTASTDSAVDMSPSADAGSDTDADACQKQSYFTGEDCGPEKPCKTGGVLCFMGCCMKIPP
jgi:hypothetical protein